MEQKKEIILKPYDPVLVREKDGAEWTPDFFGRCVADRRPETGEPFLVHECIGGVWAQCIPYEGNECLLYTCENPKPKWTPKKGDYIAVRDKGDTDWKIRVFVKFAQDGSPITAVHLNQNGHLYKWGEYADPETVNEWKTEDDPL